MLSNGISGNPYGLGNAISQSQNAYSAKNVNAEQQANSLKNTSNEKTSGEKTSQADSLSTHSYGKTFGNVKLSEKAAKYYEELKSKFGNMDFVLVSNDSIDQATALGGALGTKGKTTVLIDVDKIERMAEDEEFRAQYEGAIEEGGKQLDSMAEKLLGKEGILSYGMIVGDNGETSFFAVVDNSMKLQRERIEKKQEENRQEKAEEKKEEDKERLENLISYNRERLAKAYQNPKSELSSPSGETYISANSLDEFISKLEEYGYSFDQNSDVAYSGTYAAGSGSVNAAGTSAAGTGSMNAAGTSSAFPGGLYV